MSTITYRDVTKAPAPETVEMPVLPLHGPTTERGGPAHVPGVAIGMPPQPKREGER